MQKVLRELISQILAEGVKDTGLTTSQWWDQKGVAYTGSEASQPYFVYVDETGAEIAGSKGATGDPYTYKDLGDGRLLVTSGPKSQSVGAIVRKGASGSQAAPMPGQDLGAEDVVNKAPKKEISDEILDFSKFARFAIAKALDVNLRVVRFGRELAVSLQPQSGRILIQESSNIDDFNRRLYSSVESAYLSTKEIVKGVKPRTISMTQTHPDLAQFDAEIETARRLFVDYMNKALASLQARIEEKSPLRVEERDLLDAVDEEMKFVLEMIDQGVSLWRAGWKMLPSGILITTRAVPRYEFNGRYYKPFELAGMVVALEKQAGFRR